MKLIFADQAWEDLSFWIHNDARVAKRIIKLIEETKRSPFAGIGKPEPLRSDLAGYWSRRITEEHRLVYAVRGNELWIAQARFHYRR